MGAALQYLAWLGATLALEVPLAALLAGRGRRADTWRAALALNLLTHPAATAAIWLAGAPWLPTELAVAAVEAAGLRGLTSLGRARALGIALAANAVSALAGLALAFV
jgi:hypothetical protein